MEHPAPLQLQSNSNEVSPQISQQQQPETLINLNSNDVVLNNNNNEIQQNKNEKQNETQILESSAIEQNITEIINNTSIPPEAKQFTFGCQIMIIGLNSKSELNKKLGFVVGDYKPYSKRIPIRLITNRDPSNAPTFLLKLCNLQFVSPPIPGYDVEAYKSDSNSNLSESHSDDDSDLSDTDSGNDNDNDSDSSSSDESSLSPSIANFQSITITNTHQIDDTNTNTNDEDDDIKLTADKLRKINENTSKYFDIMQEFNRPDTTIDLSPSITSTKSLPIDCGLRWEPKAITQSIENMTIERIGTIKNIINDIEIVIESIHSAHTVITWDSVLCLKDHTPIGRVDDVIGRVKRPHYFVRLTIDKATTLKDKLTLDQDVYAVKPLSNFAVPPQTDERYSSQSECDDQSSDNDNDDDDDEQYRPNIINKKKRQRAMSVDRQISTTPMNNNNNINNNNRNRNKRNNQPHKRKYYNSNNYYNNNKRQRYSNPMPWQNLQQPYTSQAAAIAYQSYIYPTFNPTFNPLPTAIPPPSQAPQMATPSHALSAATAAFFRPQVNIIPSPPTNYINTINRYNLSSNSPQHQSPSGSVSSLNQKQTPPQQQQQRSPQQQQTQQIQQSSISNATMSINPFSFTKNKPN